MPGLSNIIENFINELIDGTENGIVEIQRNEMAEHFECSPSQINYVLSTRFTPYKGYYIESRRGGGGYIRIIKVSMEDDDFGTMIVDSIGKSLTKNKAYHILDGLYEQKIIDKRENELLKVALGDSSLLGNSEEKNIMRANMLKNILLVLSS